MAFSNHDTDEHDAAKEAAAATAAADDSMDVDSWGSSTGSSTNASQEMMMAAGFGLATPNIKQYSLSADAYPQLWQPAVLPPTVQVKLGLTAPTLSVASTSSSSPTGMAHQQQQQALGMASISSAAAAATAMLAVHHADGSVAVVDRSVPMDEDVNLDLEESTAADAEVARVTSNYSPASLNATPLAERRGNGSPEPLRLTPVGGDAGAPESTLTTPATASNATSTSSANASSTYASRRPNNETPLPTPVTPTFDGHKEGGVEDRMDVVTSASGNAQGHQQGQQQQQQVQSVEEPGLMAAMAVSE
ncbi:hypothetical protein BCR44DRAFT_1501063 [Catenaria anguillulae PL171]|uniref:Uncharacterized protein n=1 Tax=Catenaria anguillulae PL171 TaxID=765915 RepID=A0A1Y2HG91_9FUNG|nr:hypothetical protein BCR44DRAFT_1501063 [Catenaria anguillulae PL171]